MGYILISDLATENRFYETFAEILYGSNATLTGSGSVSLQSDIDFWSGWMDDQMRTVDRFSVLPLQRGTNGEFPNAVRAWCANLVVYNKLVARFQTEFEEIPSSISHYGSEALMNGSRVLTGAMIFDNEIDAGELGIGAPQVVGNLGSNTRGTFHTNWRGYPFGDSLPSAQSPDALGGQAGNDWDRGFTGSDFPRTWIVEVTTSGGVGTAKCRWSMNGGIDFENSDVTSGYDFMLLQDNVWVRFEGDSVGSHHFSVGDKWRFQTVPKDIRRTYGSVEARVGNCGRGF